MTARVVGWTAAPPTPMTARQAISSIGLPLKAASTEPTAKTRQPDEQHLAAADAVADHAPGEEQAGEHEDVGVDRPLELALGGAELALQRWAARR